LSAQVDLIMEANKKRTEEKAAKQKKLNGDKVEDEVVLVWIYQFRSLKILWVVSSVCC